MSYLSNFSDFISEHVLKEGTSLFDLSKRIGIDDYAIRQWQLAKFMPSIDSLVKVADYFNVPIDYMLGLSDSTKLIRYEPPKAFVEQLAFLMNSKNITAYRLAKDLGVGRAAVSKWMTAQRVPYFDSVIKLSLYFGCSIDFIIGRAH